MIRFDVYDKDGKLLRSAKEGVLTQRLNSYPRGTIKPTEPHDDHVKVMDGDRLIATFRVVQ